MELDLSKLSDPNLAIREFAVLDLIDSEHPERRGILSRLSPKESNIRLKYEIKRALDSLGGSLPEEGIQESKSMVPESGADRNLTEKIRKDLRSEQKEQRVKAARYISQNRVLEFSPELHQLEKTCPDVELKICIMHLQSMRGRQGLEYVFRLLKSEEELLVIAGCKILYAKGSTLCLAHVCSLIDHSNKNIGRLVISLMRKLSAIQLLHLLTAMARSSQFQLACATAIEILELSEGLPLLEEIARSSDLDISHHAREIHSRVRNKSKAVESTARQAPLVFKPGELLLDKLKQEKDVFNISCMVLALATIDDNPYQYKDLLFHYAGHKDARIRANSIESLSLILKGKERLKLLEFLEDPNNRVRANSIIALGREEDLDEEVNQKILKTLKDFNTSGDKISMLSSIYCMSELDQEKFLGLLIDLLKTSFDEESLTCPTN